MQTTSRNILLDIFKVIAAICIVALHCRLFLNQNEILYQITANGFFKIAVPLFFCINGFFLYSVFQKKGIYLWMKRIGILYGIWMLIYAYFWLIPEYSNPLKIASTILFGFNHLWYLAAMLVGGFLLYQVRNLSNTILITAAILLFLIGLLIQYLGILHVFADKPMIDKLLNYPPLHRNFLWYALPYLCIGYVIKRSNFHVKFSTSQVWILFSITLLLVIADSLINLQFIHHETLLNMNLSFLVLAPVLVIVAFTFKVNSNLDSKLLSTFSIAIYLVHPLIIYVLYRLFELKPEVLTLATIILSGVLSYLLILLNKKIKYIFINLYLVKRKLKFALVTLRNVLIIFLLLEIILGIFYNYHDESGIDGNTERAIASGVYEGTGLDDEEIKIIHRELREQDMIWEPYLHYRFKPMQGKYNTIYANGQRKTSNPSLKDSATALKIFCFGGSTMYSSGARDEHTIPSELAQLIHENFPDQNVEVTNFGCHGYTRATENIQLQQELVKNNIPDIVIFYDGVNEVISGHQNNAAGAPTNAYNRRKEFKIAHSYKKRIKLMIYSSNLYRFVTTMQRKIFSGQTYIKLSARPDSLATDIADNFIGLVKVSKSLENEYGFKVYNFMQPHIYSKKTLSEAEKIYHQDQLYYENLYTLAYEHVRQDSLMINDTTFVDISNIFDDIEKTIYLDFCHKGEYGNQLVAAAMFSTIKSELVPKIQDSVTNSETEQLTEINK